LIEAVNRPISTWQHMLRADGNPYFVSEVGEEVNGLAGASVPEQDGEVHLVSMWVDPIHRGRGISDKLVDQVIDWARSMSARRVLLVCTEGNLHAETLYFRHGFRRTAASSKRVSDGLTEFEMALELSASGR
jgi:GNAT superfamily N-acetyltransferase